uniref:Uncharacterized protein n=1 Tax=Physcomitrium patens TaxID=3218 RepID=A0A2K1IRZ9_PHYPA|nr:hypothetical protein PHYPA_026185 [Physcomitrium patens]
MKRVLYPQKDSHSSMICHHSYNCNGKLLSCILDAPLLCKTKEVANPGMSSTDLQSCI